MIKFYEDRDISSIYIVFSTKSLEEDLYIGTLKERDLRILCDRYYQYGLRKTFLIPYSSGRTLAKKILHKIIKQQRSIVQ
jgi:hypothetical protein